MSVGQDVRERNRVVTGRGSGAQVCGGRAGIQREIWKAGTPQTPKKKGKEAGQRE